MPRNGSRRGLVLSERLAALVYFGRSIVLVHCGYAILSLFRTFSALVQAVTVCFLFKHSGVGAVDHGLISFLNFCALTLYKKVYLYRRNSSFGSDNDNTASAWTLARWRRRWKLNLLFGLLRDSAFEDSLTTFWTPVCLRARIPRLFRLIFSMLAYTRRKKTTEACG